MLLQSSDGAGVHWLSAINPQLRYAKTMKWIKKKKILGTTYKSSCTRLSSQARKVPYAWPSHTHLHPLYGEPYVRVCAELQPRPVRVDVGADFPSAQGFKPELPW